MYCINSLKQEFNTAKKYERNRFDQMYGINA